MRAHNWVVLGDLLRNGDAPAWYLPLTGRLYFRKSQLPTDPDPEVFHTKCELVVDLLLLLRTATGRWGLTANLPHSREAALQLPFAEAVRYRLGKSDWVAAHFGPEDEAPLELLWEWIDESYRSVAPKRLLAHVAGPPGTPQRRPEE